MKRRHRAVYAWAAIHRKTRHPLRNLSNHYAIYGRRECAMADCPLDYGVVVRVRISEV